MAYSKLDKDEVILEDSAIAVSEVVDISNYDDFSIQMDYGANAGGDLDLEASLDGVSFVPITGAEQAADVTGGTHIWNVTDCHYRYIRITAPATASTTIRFQGEHAWD